MTLNEIFDELRSQSDLGVFGFMVQEVIYSQPTILVYNHADFDQVLNRYQLDYDSVTLRGQRGTRLVGYCSGVSYPDLKMVSVEEELAPRGEEAKK